MKATDTSTQTDIHSDKSRKLSLEVIQEIIEKHEARYKDKFFLNPKLDRKLVSFQDNRKSPIYRLFKYKEAFSANLVSYLINYLNLKTGSILDPFSGTGTTSLVASKRGIQSIGIELLPIGNLIAEARYELTKKPSQEIVKQLQFWQREEPWKQIKEYQPLKTLRITQGAYSPDNEVAISRFIQTLQVESKPVETLLLFAVCAVLEEISYTRKDGQYLRWDYRSGRRKSKNTFNKGTIYNFEEAIKRKLDDILQDSLFENGNLLAPLETPKEGNISFISGSSLEKIQEIKDRSFDAVITSPPYCNRYDYTRTYALELAALGVDEEEIVKLRQAMLSCTVENREKDLYTLNPAWRDPILYCSKHEVLSAILSYLKQLRDQGELNNKGIPRMIDGYFKEMACIIFECARVLKTGGYIAMVNDNVRYAGAAIPVDTILSDIAAFCGLETIKIMVLPNSKGNSSQQMGLHGKSNLRKCIYIWQKQ